MGENKGFFSKVKVKAKKFWDEYGAWIVLGGLFVGGAAVGGLVMRDCVNDEERRKIRAELQPSYDAMYQKAKKDAMYDLGIKKMLEAATKEEEEENDSLWTEEQRDTWDELCECVSKLDILPDEEYCIGHGDLDWDEGVKIGKNIIYHTIEGAPTYPPDCEAYIDADWSEDDEEEDEDDDISEEDEDEENVLKIKLSKDASEDVKDLCQQFIEFVENGDIKVWHF